MEALKMSQALLADIGNRAKETQAKETQAKATQARAVLSCSRIFDLRCLEVRGEGDCVVLRGSVDSFYHKQLAQELVKTAIDGVEVANLIRVDYRRAAEDDSDWRS
jgi:osmotically-inducible protein OsmY